MNIEFIGADHEVTGSCHYVECGDTRLIVDYGMEQGANVYENAPLPVSPSELDYVLVTHAHIDHTGMLPVLVKNGFTGTILLTDASGALCDIMIRDSAHIQESDAEYKNRKNQRAGREKVEPLYTTEDAERTYSLMRSVPYGELVELSDHVSARFIDAGHLLGSASIELFLKEDGVEKKVVFSGDIGNTDKPLIRDPQYIDSADYVITESTYGNREHEPYTTHVDEFREILQDTFDRGGNVVIPAFAVGRTQEILYFMNQIKMGNMIHGHDHFEVWVDSPLAVEATRVFRENLLECYDEETKALVSQGINPISFDGLKLSITSDDSKALNFMDYPKVIISAAGMCDAGRIRHHLKHNLWRPECTVVFAGYQSEGTLGRILQDGAEMVKIFGEDIEVKAKIETIHGISSHADQEGLLKWLEAFNVKKPDKVFVVHGDDEVASEYAKLVKERLDLDAEAPFSGSVFDLAAGRWIKVTSGIPIAKGGSTLKSVRDGGVFAKLKAALERLIKLVENSRDCANSDIKKLTEQISKICDKWENY